MTDMHEQDAAPRARPGSWMTGVVLGTGMLVLLILMAISGGVSSQFSVLVPLFPLFGTLLANRLRTLWIACFWVAVVIVGAIYGGDMSRGIWIVIAIVTGTFFALRYEKSIFGLQRELKLQTTRDLLTGVVNRRSLDEFLDRELVRRTRSGSSLSLMIVDVDHLKRVNDEFGHSVGDRCLQKVAQALEDHTRTGQDLVARFSGEEFVVVLTDTNTEQAYRVAENIRAAVAELQVQATQEIQISITVTVGCATAEHEATSDVLFKAADQALYRGKAQGRNRVERPVLLDQSPVALVSR